MKKMIVCLVLTAAFITGYSTNSSAVTLNEKIQKEITYPEFAKENNEQGFVLVSFTVDNEGKIVVKQVNSDNPVLRSYVVKKIEELTVECDDETCKDYTMKFEFRLI